jgi:hypothetical protein
MQMRGNDIDPQATKRKVIRDVGLFNHNVWRGAVWRRFCLFVVAGLDPGRMSSLGGVLGDVGGCDHHQHRT